MAIVKAACQLGYGYQLTEHGRMLVKSVPIPLSIEIGLSPRDALGSGQRPTFSA
jgi:hypothetical protein